MNILPKKRWHVRTKANIERVRKDEAKAAEEEKERQRRIQLAEQEARTSFLRERARKSGDEPTDPSTALVPIISPEHVNVFQELEDGKKNWGTNKEHEIEKREEQEKFEKSIGLLTYLGQGSAELQADKPWYFHAPKKRKFDDKDDEGEVATKSKTFLDPLEDMKRFVGSEHYGAEIICETNSKSGEEDGKSSKKHKHHKDKEKKADRRRDVKVTSSGKSIAELRAERMNREREERLRAEKLLARFNGETSTKSTANEIDGHQGYNSQFNPHLARQSRKNNQ